MVRLDRFRRIVREDAGEALGPVLLRVALAPLRDAIRAGVLLPTVGGRFECIRLEEEEPGIVCVESDFVSVGAELA